MNRAFQNGYLEIDFPVERFGSVPHLLAQSARVFLRNFRFVAAATLAVFLPAKLALQFVCYLFDVPTGGLLMYLLLDASDLVLGSLVAPAVIYGLMRRFHSGALPPLAESLRWGRRQWGRTLWNRFKVEITVTLWGALLIVPGLVKMVQLAFTDPIVAIEGDREFAVLERSRDITKGHRWRIFFVVLPVMLAELAGSYLVLGAFHGPADSRFLIGLVDSLLSVGGQWATTVTLLMYLGLTDWSPQPARPAASRQPGRNRR
jgi:hypothetical protein